MVLKYHAKIDDSPLSDLLKECIIKTDNQMIMLSDSIRKDCPDNGRSTRACIVFYQVGLIDHCTNALGPVYKSSAESE